MSARTSDDQEHPFNDSCEPRQITPERRELVISLGVPLRDAFSVDPALSFVLRYPEEGHCNMFRAFRRS